MLNVVRDLLSFCISAWERVWNRAQLQLFTGCLVECVWVFDAHLYTWLISTFVSPFSNVVLFIIWLRLVAFLNNSVIVATFLSTFTSSDALWRFRTFRVTESATVVTWFGFVVHFSCISTSLPTHDRKSFTWAFRDSPASFWWALNLWFIFFVSSCLLTFTGYNFWLCCLFQRRTNDVRDWNWTGRFVEDKKRKGVQEVFTSPSVRKG